MDCLEKATHIPQHTNTVCFFPISKLDVLFFTLRPFCGCSIDKKLPADTGAINKICQGQVPFSATEPFQRANKHKSSNWTLNSGYTANLALPDTRDHRTVHHAAVLMLSDVVGVLSHNCMSSQCNLYFWEGCVRTK